MADGDAIRTSNLPAITTPVEVLAHDVDGSGNKRLGRALVASLASTISVPTSTAGLPDSTDRRYVTDAQRSVLAGGAFSAGYNYATKAALNSDLTPPANAQGAVRNDSIPGNNGYYQKVGGTGTGSWTRIGPLDSPLNFLTLLNISRIVLIGNSYGAGHYQPYRKPFVQILSALVDYNIENYSLSGLNFATEAQQLINDAPTSSGTLSPQDHGGGYALIFDFTNGLKYHSNRLSYYINNMRRIAEAAQACGLFPIFVTEFTGTNNRMSARSMAFMAAACRDHGWGFWDLSSESAITNFGTGTAVPGYWGLEHPGVRTQSLWVIPLAKKINSELPRPRSGIKIFRPRPTWPVSVIDDVLYDTIDERAERLEEVNIGHQSLQDSQAPWYDKLDTLAATGFLMQGVVSEYLKLGNYVPGVSFEQVAFSNFIVVEITLDTDVTSVDSVTITLTDDFTNGLGVLQAYTKDVLHSTTYDATLSMQQFNVASLPGVITGAKYSDGAGNTFTIVDQFTLATGENIVTAALDGAGATVAYFYANGQTMTLTRTSGSGAASFATTGAYIGYPRAYYDALAKPHGTWTLQSMSNGVLTLTRAQLLHAMQQDKITLMIYRGTTFNLTGISVRWLGQRGKVRPPLNTLPPPATSGTHLLAQRNFTGTVLPGSWTAVGTVAPVVPDEGSGIMPRDPDSPGSQLTKVVRVTSVNKIRTPFTPATDALYGGFVEVSVMARRYVPVYTPPSTGPGSEYADWLVNAPIRAQTWDYTRLRMSIDTASGDRNEAWHNEVVGLHWNVHRFVFEIPSSQLVEGSLNLMLSCPDTGKTVEIAWVAIRDGRSTEIVRILN
jgi:hypothetical protein